MTTTNALLDQADLPLRYATPPSWAATAMGDIIALLNDHAHLEKKAALNALELLHRWPEPIAPENWATTLCAVARDEAEHLAHVTRLICRRGGELEKFHANAYAKALRALVRNGQGPLEIMDRLMISALIEARSCERFALLAEAAVGVDDELAKLYKGLWASEHGHYRVFIQLARDLPHVDAAGIEARWSWMLDEEASIIERQPAGPAMHSGAA